MSAAPLARLQEERPVREMYALLDAYYEQNGLYDELAVELRAAGFRVRDERPLRNPAHRIVESYADHIWPGHDLARALPIQTENEAIFEPIQQIWQWSNWASRKQRVARWFALYGDLFLKAVAREGNDPRTYIQPIRPAWVTEWEEDERGFVTWIRLDYVARRGRGDLYYHTETWSKAAQEMRVWERDKQPADDTKLDALGTPSLVRPFAEMGIDFVPFVYQPLRDSGLGRAGGAFTHAIEKIDEANRQATTLHRRLFRYNRSDLALEGVGTSADGRPIPAPLVGDGAQTIDIDGETLWRLPSGWRITHLTANLPFGDALAILNAQMEELENDLPELVFDRLKEKEQMSGRALRIMAARAISRFEEARGNAEAALVRADQMCLTLGQHLGIWRDLTGDFDSGALDHTFAERAVVPLTTQDRAETFHTLVQGGQVPVRWALKKTGLLSDEDEEEFDQEVVAQRASESQSLALGVLAASAARDRGDTLGLEQG